jgi:hypothetical protein
MGLFTYRLFGGKAGKKRLLRRNDQVDKGAV